MLAGAGSGKTRVIVHKIAHLLQGGLAPDQIAAITFTNKAAAEMRERARAMVGARAAKALVICTFHALGVRMLREHGELLGLKARFSILDSDDVLAVHARRRRHHRRGAGAALAVDHQRLEEPGPDGAGRGGARPATTSAWRRA